jgi:hypothetical protein
MKAQCPPGARSELDGSGGVRWDRRVTGPDASPRRRRAAGLLAVAGVVAVVGIAARQAGEPALEPSRPSAPAGLQPGSLILRAPFATAMRLLAAERLGRLYTLRLAPDRIDARLLTHDGRIRDVRIRPGGRLRRRGTSAGGFGFVDTIPFARVAAAAPERATRAAARRLGLHPRQVEFLSLTRAGWTVVFDGGRQLTADRLGRLRRPSAPPRGTR